MESNLDKVMWITQQELIEKSVSDILYNLGVEVTDSNRETPLRYAKFITKFCNPEKPKLTTFEVASDEVIVKGIRVNSLCEHHLLPFFGEAVVLVMPNKKTNRVLGLSKFQRIVTYCSNGLKTQEQITQDIRKMIIEVLQPQGCIVVLKCEHTCMTLRGVESTNSKTLSCAASGIYDNRESKMDFCLNAFNS